MSEDKKQFETWDEVIGDFFERKKEALEESFLKDEIKKLASIYEKHAYFNEEYLVTFFDPKKNKREKGQSTIEFQKSKFQQILNFSQKPNGFDGEIIQENYRKKIEDIEAKFEPQKWIGQASNDASSVTFATHVFKLTHSKIDSKAMLDQIDDTKFEYLTTSSIQNKIIDGAVTGNQYAPIYQFLELELDGKKLAEVFTDINSKVLKNFVTNEKEILELNRGFSRALVSSKPQSHSLAKQVYFLLENGVSTIPLSYHLLANVDSSTLAHALNLKLSDKEQKRVRAIQQKNRYSEEYRISYPNNAVRMVTQSNHGNASQLNGKRGGRLTLLQSQPPTWKNELKPPIYKSSFFYAIPWNVVFNENIDYLRDFLLRFERLGLSFKDPKKIEWIKRWVEQIIDEVFAYCASVQNMPSGWSSIEDIKLKVEHRYLLDPFRKDMEFQEARNLREWQTVVCKDFANWLNGRLKGRDRQFTPQPEHIRLWKELMEEQLREFDESTVMEIKSRKREAV